MMIAFLFIFIQTSSSAAINEVPANKPFESYNPEKLLLKIFNINDTEVRAGYGFVNLDNEQNREYFDNAERNYLNHVKFDDFNDNSAQQLNQNSVNYQHGLNSDVTKRRRRRKPKQNYNGFTHHGAPYYGGPNNYPFLSEQHHTPSLVSSALSSVTRALSSIAKYDDRQCVARLLCEAAGGALSSSIFERVSGLQPLLTLLTAYSGLSSTPLLVFGRAVLLGASSPNTASCRYAHPLCPTDTEELVYYLNNYNGGFFRFFNAPEQEQENLGQFYNQLSQNDLHRPNQYGLYHQDLQQNNRPRPHPDTGYHQYGLAFPYNDYRFKNNDGYRYGDKIEKRIQNKPIIEYAETHHEQTNKLIFPEDNNANKDYGFNDYLSTNDLNYVKNDEFKFPEDTNLMQNNYRKIRGFSFPGSHADYTDYNYLTKPTNERFIFGNYNYPTYNRYLYTNKDNLLNKDRVASNIQTVYVVRGNGDPNRPEIIHLRPGEVVHK